MNAAVANAQNKESAGAEVTVMESTSKQREIVKKKNQYLTKAKEIE